MSVAKLDEHQVLAYDLAHAASAVAGCSVMLEYGAKGEQESMLARRLRRRRDLGPRHQAARARGARGASTRRCSLPRSPFVEAHRSPELPGGARRHAAEPPAPVPPTCPTTSQLAAETFHRFAEDKIRPHAEHVHRTNADVPEDVITGLAELGGFGLSVPEEYGGMAAGGEADYLGMVVATEELSWGSLGIGGSLITRPEILTRALVTGGTDEQKQRWLPRIAAGELMVGVMVTEPDYGSDVAGVGATATPVDGGYRGQRREDVGHVRRARRPADAARAHRPRPLQDAPRPVAVRRREGAVGRALVRARRSPTAARIEGRAIDTLGYRGMHSFEVSFADWFVPAENLVGGEGGLGKGFYLQMEGFENGRLQTAARAVGLMQAAFDAGLAYAQERKVFGQPVFDYQLSKAKLARMAATDPGRAAVLLRRGAPDGRAARARWRRRW